MIYLDASLIMICLVPETQNATLEDVSALFEQSNTWLIGPGSKKRLAQIVANRESIEATGADGEKAFTGHIEKLAVES